MDTELSAHLRDGAPEAIGRQVQGMELLCPEGIADTVSYIVTPDCRVAVNQFLVRAGEQT
ncbi:hypothetical protein HCJ76_02715 [Streptomyces sp. MC1]|uniref:hypothetical protein n=1 Tax=Streptomyces sp. MC1 TaxID=295105 RepID=UPI0018C9518C|nr:hypothetical protein [Streptomyces sp. MC1]MBG7697039.1 hypothetical protein [Streptomyces sp. MC1]